MNESTLASPPMNLSDSAQPATETRRTGGRMVDNNYPNRHSRSALLRLIATSIFSPNGASDQSMLDDPAYLERCATELNEVLASPTRLGEHLATLDELAIDPGCHTNPDAHETADITCSPELIAKIATSGFVAVADEVRDPQKTLHALLAIAVSGRTLEEILSEIVLRQNGVSDFWGKLMARLADIE